MILSMDPDNSLILCLRLSAIIYNNALLVFSTEFVRQADIHILFLMLEFHLFKWELCLISSECRTQSFYIQDYVALWRSKTQVLLYFY